MIPGPPRDVDPAPDRTWGGAVVGGLLATLELPATWAIALAGFLARGGLIAFALPILVVPSPAGIQAVLSPLLVPVVFGQVSTGLLVLAGLAAVLVVGSLLLGGLAGAWADVVLARRVAGLLDGRPEFGHPGPRGGTGEIVVAVLAARLIAHAPLALALAWGAARIFEAGYRELVTPFEVTNPLILRIVSGAPDALAIVTVAWLLGEAAGGLAAREVTLAGAGPVRAVLLGWAGLVRRPIASLGTIGLTWLLIVVAVLPGLVASATAWTRLRAALFDRGQPEDVLPALLVFVALWLGSLVLAGVAASGRSAIWTAEWRRRRAPAPGTIVQAGDADRGDWLSGEGSGTL